MFAGRWVRIGAVVIVAAAVGVGVWLAVRHSGSSPRASSGTTDVSQQSLRALTGSIGRPVYWAGPRSGVTYELTDTSDKRIYVRYLPVGVRAGSPHPYLTVGSYVVPHAYRVTLNASRASGDVVVPVSGGAVAFYAKARPTNVYLAFRNANEQIEVFAPAAGVARRLVAGGAIEPVGKQASATAAKVKATRTSPAALATLASTLGRPVYWLGPIAGTKLELTRSPDGRVYVRYLPAGVAVGSSQPFLTVATYPVTNGLAVTKLAAGKVNSVRIPLAGGAVAVYSKTKPTNVYLAFPGVPEQIEVFDPAAGVARRLVAQAKVKAVS